MCTERIEGEGWHDVLAHCRHRQLPAGKGPDQRRPREDGRHHGRVDPHAHRHRTASHRADPDETSSSLAEHAARRALRSAGLTVEDVDFIVVGTTTPDRIFPNTGTLLQERLGIHGCPAFSLETACSGFIYALSVADKFVRLGEAKCALVVGVECLTPDRRLDGPRHLRAVRRRRRRRGADAVGRGGHHQYPPALGRSLQGPAVLPLRRIRRASTS